MIRRGFWLTVGAVGGIMAYRRAAQVAERGWARETIRFSRDVREGKVSAERARQIYGVTN